MFVTTCPVQYGNAQPTTSRQETGFFYHFRKLAQAEGLSSYNVKKILQDSYGYTWIATQDGLNRYDGRSIIIYNKAIDSPRRLVNTDIWDLAEDTVRHLLWVLSYSGLNSIDLSSGRVLPNPAAIAANSPQFANAWFKCLQPDGQRLWIGSNSSRGLIVYNTARQAFDSIEPLPQNPAHSVETHVVDKLWKDEYDRIWAFMADYGIVIYSGATGRIIQRHPLGALGLGKSGDLGRFRNIDPISPGRLAVATNEGLFEVLYSRYKLTMRLFPLPGGSASLARGETYCSTCDRQGRLWFGSGNALYRQDPATGRTIQVKDAATSSPENWFTTLNCIYFDKFDHLWLGSQKGAAFSTVQPSPFVSWFQSADFSCQINHANYVYSFHDSLLYACAEDGFYEVNTASNIIRIVASGRFIYAGLLKDRQVIVSREDRLFLLRQGRLQRIEEVYPELKAIDSQSINSLAWCGDSLAVMGSENLGGVLLWDPIRHRVDSINDHTTPLALPSNIVNTVYRDHLGRIWILSDASYSIYDPRRKNISTHHFDDPNTHLPVNFYFDVAEAGGSYWLAIYGTGLFALDSTLNVRRFISTREGLANAGVYKVNSWHDSTLFVTSNNGLSLVRLPHGLITNYFQQDGLHGNGFEESCAWFDGHFIFAGGEHGVSRIEPEAIPTDAPAPPLRFSNIRLQTTSSARDLGDISSDVFTVPSDVVQASFTLSTFNYTDGERTLLSYSIPELKTRWIPLKAGQTIDLLGPPPGGYTLLVKAINSSGNARQTSLIIHWLPKWYQTLWFKLLVLFAVVSLSWLFYRYRISQIRKQHLIRQNISSDLHDDIGSILNTIKIFTHLARKNAGDGTWLTQIETSLTQAAGALRDMIWVLDDSLDTVFELTERIRQFAIPVTNAQDIHFEIVIDTMLYHQPLLKEEKRNLLLIAKESINNSLKYASCSNISIHIGLEHKVFTMKIEDNGSGFDAGSGSNGNGLKNIRQRAAQMRYQSMIESSPGNGTRIVLTKC